MLVFFRKYGLSVAVALTVFYLSITHSLPSDKAFHIEGIDKVVHFLMYFGLTIAITLDHYRLGVNFSSKKMWIWAIAFPILYGGFIELIQPYFLRSAEWFDWMADTLGVITAFVLASQIYSKIKILR